MKIGTKTKLIALAVLAICTTLRAQVQITLPAPIVRETFDSVEEGKLPAGWSVVNFTDSLTAGDDLDDPKSDSYLNWVVISRERVLSIGAAGRWEGDRRLLVAPNQFLNGSAVTNLVEGKFIYAESDVRGANQVQFLFSPDFNVSGKSNVFLFYNSIYEQNQDSIASVEYSIDEGKTWLPIVYMIDVPDIIRGADGSIDGFRTLNETRGDAAVYTDPTTGTEIGHSYGAFIGVTSNKWSTLAPFISGRINDDPVESKRIELFRLPQADNQAKVRFRFAQAGTGSWYFGIDNFGLYSIAQSKPTRPTISGAATAPFFGDAIFTSSPFKATAPNQTHALSVWQISSSSSFSATNGFANVLESYSSAKSLTSLSVLLGRVRPGTTCYATVQYKDQTGAASDFAEPISFIVSGAIPPPLFLETFESTTEGTVPAGWKVENQTDGGGVGEDPADFRSDTYLNWAVVTFEHLSGFGAERITDTNVISGKSLYANSDSRTGNQIQYVTTSDFNLTGKSNVWLMFKSNYMQNQDSFGGLEYSIDGGTSWLPILYMIDQPDIFVKTDGSVDAVKTLTTTYGDVAKVYTDPATGDRVAAGKYADFILAKPLDSLGPFISGRVNDDARESKRIERFRLTAADNQAKVRFRLAQAGTDSWFWGVDDFGLYSVSSTPKPEITAQPQSLTVLVGGNATFAVVATGADLRYQWQLNGTVIAGATAATLTLANVTAQSAGKYSVVVSNAGGSVTSQDATLTVSTTPIPALITEGLAAYLKFDGDFKDSSGNGNNGTAVGAPTIGAGKIGSGALVVTSKKDGSSFNYVTLGTPDLLKFGTNTDFSISFWANYKTWEGDPAFVANKDWNSGGNIGFVIATDGDGRLQWNYRVTGGAARKDYDGPGGSFTGGGWHHVVVSFARNGDAKSYLDGKLVNTTAIGPSTGIIESGLPINIGQDGTGKYTDGNKVSVEGGMIDEVAIWRRVLDVSEVQKVYVRGSAGVSLDSPAITEDLAVHLAFDGDLKDTSGNGNNGTAVGAPTFGPGKIGSGAVVVTSKKDGTSFNYVTLGTPDSLKFGTNTDFSVSFWANYKTWEGDPAFVANKDWNSGGNIGFVIATDGDGRLQWNYRVTGGAARKDYDGPGGSFTGGGWHHVVVSFARNGDAKAYLDGKLVNTTAIGPSTGIIESGLPINIGQDGTGKYTDGNKVSVDGGSIDDVAIWRRILGEAEVKAIYDKGAAGSSFDATAPTGIKVGSIAVSATSVTLNWSGGAGPFLVQAKSSLSDTSWTTVLVTTGNSAAVARTTDQAFFRITSGAQTTATSFKATLSGAAEVPPVVATATAFGNFTLDGTTLIYAIAYTGLSGNPTGAHIHGPATASQTAPVLIPFNVSAGTSGIISGTATLTAQQATWLKDGMLYANIHTVKNPGGEIRGQITP